MVVDDHQLLIDGIKMTLSDQHEIIVVAEANNGQEALEKLHQESVDVVLMDINMPVMDGLDCTLKIKEQFPAVRVIALSQYPEKRFVRNMVKNGASGYLLKDTSKNELIDAISTVHHGGTYLDDRLSNIFPPESSQKESNKLFPRLTQRELEILRLISMEYSSYEIAEKLIISFHTVETHRANLMLKAGARNTAGLMRWAIENELL